MRIASAMAASSQASNASPDGRDPPVNQLDRVSAERKARVHAAVSTRGSPEVTRRSRAPRLSRSTSSSTAAASTSRVRCRRKSPWSCAVPRAGSAGGRGSCSTNSEAATSAGGSARRPFRIRCAQSQPTVSSSYPSSSKSTGARMLPNERPSSQGAWRATSTASLSPRPLRAMRSSRC